MQMFFMTGSKENSTLHTVDLYLSFLYSGNKIASPVTTVIIRVFTDINGLPGTPISFLVGEYRYKLGLIIWASFHSVDAESSGANGQTIIICFLKMASNRI